LTAKLHVISTNRLISFGTKYMSLPIANCYRLGYWLMALGVLLTFCADTI
jgi:hypothetical protein